VLAQKAVDYLQQVDTGKPFYLQLNLDGPYALPPTNYGPARNRHYRRFAGRDFASMPVEPVNDRILKRLTGPFIASHAIENGVDGMSLDEIWNSLLYRTMRMQGDRDSYANFLSQNKLVDDAVGSVWKALVERGLDGNTIVIYSSDQGNLFGQHGSWGHTIWFWPAHLFDAAMRIPLIVYHPEVRERGVASDRLVGQYDLAPTLLALAGVTEVELEDSPGKSLVPDLLGKPDRAEAPGAVFFEQEESRGIRTREYAYWKRADGMGEPELYDVAGDPEQRNDLFPQRRNDDIVAQLDGELESFFARYSTAEYDLWHGGVAKGTTPNPVPWLKAHPLPWIKKFWRDFVTGPVVADRFEE